MPELPEVESTAAFLRERVVGKTIVRVRVLWNRSIANRGHRKFCEQVSGSTIRNVGRRGKFVLFDLEGSNGVKSYLFGHMRMSGSFDVIKSRNEIEKHDRIIFSLDNESDIRFHDPRKFGRFFLADELEEVTGRLGLEPLESTFTVESLAQILTKRNGAIKPLLLNQALVAGLGNIYVDEALWYAGVHPQTPSSRLRNASIAKLHQGIVEILREAITNAGTDFGDGVVEGGGYSPRVYGRNGEPCYNCHSKIRRIVVGQRGTHICPKCQRKRA